MQIRNERFIVPLSEELVLHCIFESTSFPLKYLPRISSRFHDHRRFGGQQAVCLDGPHLVLIVTLVIQILGWLKYLCLIEASQLFSLLAKYVPSKVRRRSFYGFPFQYRALKYSLRGLQFRCANLQYGLRSLYFQCRVLDHWCLALTLRQRHDKTHLLSSFRLLRKAVILCTMALSWSRRISAVPRHTNSCFSDWVARTRFLPLASEILDWLSSFLWRLSATSLDDSMTLKKPFRSRLRVCIWSSNFIDVLKLDESTVETGVSNLQTTSEASVQRAIQYHMMYK